MHGHSFERIWTKLGVWHPYTLRIVMDRLASTARTRRLARARRLAFRAPSIYTAANGWRTQLGHSELAASNRNGSSAVGARCNRAPNARGWSAGYV